MITPLMWIGVIFGAAVFLYFSARIFVDGYDLPRPHHLPRHRRNP